MSHLELAFWISSFLAAGGTIKRLPPGNATPVEVFAERFKPQVSRLPLDRRLALMRKG